MSSDARNLNWRQRLRRSQKAVRLFFSKDFWKNWFRKPTDDLTLVLMGKGHLEVQKLHVAPQRLWMIKMGIAALVFILMMGGFFTLDFIIQYPSRALTRNENVALKLELQKLQFNLDSLQSAVERVERFDEKLRAITDVDKEFSKMKGPAGQGGGDPETTDLSNIDFGNFQIDPAALSPDQDSDKYLDRRESFMIQRMYSWMRRLFRSADLQEQSTEELFEVLKGREIQIAAKPTVSPVGGWITSPFGYRVDPFNGESRLHRGIDFAARSGAPVVAPADGVVTFAGPYGSYGNAVMLFHGYGISTLYAHNHDVVVHVGQKVKRGDVISHVGSSGRSTGSHLHYEVILHGVPVDPRKYILDRAL